MSKSCGVLKVIGYSFGASVAASLSVLLIGACAFGFRLAEWKGRFVGLVGTVAGIVGAVVGLKMALRTQQRRVN